MKTMNKTKIALISGLILALIVSGVFFVSNKSLKKDIKGEKIKSEALLSEKLLLDKSLAKFKTDLKSMIGKNTELDKKVATISQKLATKENEAKKLIAENASLQSLKVKIKEIEALKNQLNEELYAFKMANDKYKLENQLISNQLADALKENNQLSAHNSILKAIAGNNYRIEAVRGKNDKLTVNARRAQKLVVTFDLPNDVGNEINFKLITPDNKEFASTDNKLATINITENNDNFYASIKDMGVVGTKRVEMVYKPSEKLSKGIYEFKIYNEGVYIGSSQLRLK